MAGEVIPQEVGNPVLQEPNLQQHENNNILLQPGAFLRGGREPVLQEPHHKSAQDIDNVLMPPRNLEGDFY